MTVVLTIFGILLAVAIVAPLVMMLGIWLAAGLTAVWEEIRDVFR